LFVIVRLNGNIFSIASSTCDVSCLGNVNVCVFARHKVRLNPRSAAHHRLSITLVDWSRHPPGMGEPRGLDTGDSGHGEQRMQVPTTLWSPGQSP
ncbi:unnamed protein product, partial [Protopolystoma xenopodis]